MSIMGVDVGSTACKAMVFSNTGEILAYTYVEYEKETPTQISPVKLLLAAKEVIAKAASLAKSPVTSLCISSFGESFVLLDEHDRPLDNILLYTDQKGQKQCNEMVEKVGETRFKQSAGVKPNPMYSLAKIAYYSQEKPEIFSKTKKIVLIGEYLSYYLTGINAIDYSLASRTMAFDVVNKRWDKELIFLSGAEVSQLSPPVDSGTIIGKVISKTAGELGLDPSCIVVAGGHDQVCAATGAGILKSGLAIDGIGTVECITPCFERPVLTDNFLDNNYACVPYTKPGHYTTYMFNFTGGSLLKWYRDTFTKGFNGQGGNFYAYMDSIGQKTPSDLIVIPHFAGSATPDMNANAKGVIWGLSFDTDNAALYRGLLEGVTLEMMYNLEKASDAGISITELRATGGGAKSKYWLQIKADMTGLPIRSLDVKEAGIVGAAILAGKASGLFKTLEEGADCFVKERELILPNPINTKIYEQKYEKYKTLRNIKI